mgnify:CR=1 FL=1
MIVIDYSQTIISTLMAEVGGRTDIEVSVPLLRHMVLNAFRSHKQKFGADYGQVVIACDSRKYWRKEYFPNYKANRKKAREDSGYDWSAIFNAISTIKEELKQISPYPVIEVEGAEADDVIASLAKWTAENELEEFGLLPKAKPFLVVSGDHDFIQLQKFDHVKQYSPVHKKFVKPEVAPDVYVIEHIIRGDKGDGVPNVLSSDDCIVNGERQKPVSTKKLNEWIEIPSSMPDDDNFKRNYQRNRILVDFDCIPLDIRSAVINSYKEQGNRDKSKLLNYFIENKMKNMIELIGDF